MGTWTCGLVVITSLPYIRMRKRCSIFCKRKEKVLFEDVLYQDPKKDSPSWSLDGGIIVKRKSNPKEATVEAHGLVDGQPTSKHFNILVYDDVVTIDNVRSPEMIEKTTQAWELSLNLCSKDPIRRYIGTRY